MPDTSALCMNGFGHNSYMEFIVIEGDSFLCTSESVGEAAILTLSSAPIAFRTFAASGTRAGYTQTAAVVIMGWLLSWENIM
ncbi:hypothetical protein J437_LFUL019662, partial [Ladona fulva]